MSDGQMGLKIFSARFSKLLSTNNLDEYNQYIEGKRAIKLKNHPDFHYFRNTQFFNSLTYGMEDTRIPADSSYGLCAILTYNYGKIRGYITHPSFLLDSRFNLLRTYQISDEVQLDTILLQKQELVSRHRNIADYSPEDLSSMLSFMKLYLLYLYSLEDPNSARNLNARDFYDFGAPKSEYPQQPAYNPEFESQQANRLYPQLPINDTQCPYPLNNDHYSGYLQPSAPGFRPEFLQ